MYSARVECDSLYPTSDERLTTFVVSYPWRVLAEVATHRLVSDSWNDTCYERTTTKAISKNSASSRAIPLAKFIKKIQEDPYIPDWTANQRGMQGAAILDTDKVVELNAGWLETRDQTILHVERLAALGVHKQDLNPLLMSWAWVEQVLTATSTGWSNFFALRTHKDAHPAFQRIARMMYIAYKNSVPTELKKHEWHTPFYKSEVFSCNVRDILVTDDIPLALKTSAVRCAWVSYCGHDGDGSIEKVERTWDMLTGGELKHVSPLEHQATPTAGLLATAGLRSNFKDWVQLRKLIKDECITFTPSDEEVNSWNIDERNLCPKAGV